MPVNYFPKPRVFQSGPVYWRLITGNNADGPSSNLKGFNHGQVCLGLDSWSPGHRSRDCLYVVQLGDPESAAGS